MITIDLITGFLGAGKTTFLLGYAKYLMRQGLKIGILEYDYGAVNADMLLLQELRGEQCELEMLAAACDADCLRRRFRTKLISMAMSGYDRVLVEPSGVFDMDEFFDTLQESPLDRLYEAGTVVTVLDARKQEALSPEAEFIFASQTAAAGVIVLSRSQLVSDREKEESMAVLERAAEKIHLKRDFMKVLLDKNWQELTDEDYRHIQNAGYRLHDYVKLYTAEDAEYQSLYFLNTDMQLIELRSILAELFAAGAYGEVRRVKGCVADGARRVLVNATARECNVQPVEGGKGTILVIGTGLQEAAIQELMKKAQ